MGEVSAGVQPPRAQLSEQETKGLLDSENSPASLLWTISLKKPRMAQGTH